MEAPAGCRIAVLLGLSSIPCLNFPGPARFPDGLRVRISQQPWDGNAIIYSLRETLSSVSPCANGLPVLSRRLPAATGWLREDIEAEPVMETLWKIELFGGLRALQGDRVVDRFRTQKTGALLGYLAFHPDRLHTREQLIELLWPDGLPEAGRNSLSVALSSLRQQLEPPHSVRPGSVLAADRFHVRLCREAITTDVAEFEAALQAAAGNVDPMRRIPALAHAARSYRGQLLPGYYEDWIAPQQVRLGDLFQRACYQLTRLLEKAGDLEGALESARSAVRVDPLHEEMHREVLRLLIVLGRPAAAVRHFEELAKTLRKELRADPSPATRSVAAQAVALAGGASGHLSLHASPPQSAAAGETESRENTTSIQGAMTFLLAEIVADDGKETLAEIERQALLEWADTGVNWTARKHGGRILSGPSDVFVAAFRRANDALACCRAILHPESDIAALSGAARLRIALDTAEVEPDENRPMSSVLDHGLTVLRAARAGQILCAEVTATLLHRASEPDVLLRDLGIHLIQGRPWPERLFCIEYPGMPVENRPPLNVRAAFPGNLPVPLTRFIGRADALEELCALLLPEANLDSISTGPDRPSGARCARLLTLTGPGGSGKTRLALEIARRLMEPLCGTVWFVPLADVNEPEGILPAIQEARRLPVSRRTDLLEQIVDSLSGRPALLVLDNFEQLLEPSAQDGVAAKSEKAVGCIKTLLEALPALRVLITSRQRLNMAGEREYPTPPLTLPKNEMDEKEEMDEKDVSTLLQSESVRLFLDRAQDARPDFLLTAADVAEVAALCRQLEGIPLGIEIAAARTAVLTPRQIREEVEQRRSLLPSLNRPANSRHKTLRATLEWTYRLLPPAQQRFFALLSVFRGSWSLEAAEHVSAETADSGDLRGALEPAGAHDPVHALDALAQLRDFSLIGAKELSGEMRFSMLDIMREYAAEQLDSADSHFYQKRHAQFYVRLANRWESARQAGETSDTVRLMEPDLENFRSALAWSLASEPGLALSLARPMAAFWKMRGHWAEGREMLERVAKTIRDPEPAAYARLLNDCALIACYLGDRAGAHARLQQSHVLATASGNPRIQFETLTSMGIVASYQADRPAAQQHFEAALELARALEDRSGIARLLNNLGLLAVYRHDDGAARPLLEESLEIARAIGEPGGIGSALQNLGMVAVHQGEYATARQLFEEALVLQRSEGDRFRTALALNGLAMARFAEADIEGAAPLLEESLALRREIGDRLGISHSLHDLGLIEAARGDLAAAERHFFASLAVKREIGDQNGIAQTLTQRGEVARRNRQFSEACACYRESLAHFLETDERHGAAECLTGVGMLAQDAERLPAATCLLSAVARLREVLSMPLEPVFQMVYAQRIADLRQALGEERFAFLWSAGRSLTWEAMMETAFGVLED